MLLELVFHTVAVLVFVIYWVQWMNGGFGKPKCTTLATCFCRATVFCGDARLLIGVKIWYWETLLLLHKKNGLHWPFHDAACVDVLFEMVKVLRLANQLTKYVSEDYCKAKNEYAGFVLETHDVFCFWLTEFKGYSLYLICLYNR